MACQEAMYASLAFLVISMTAALFGFSGFPPGVTTVARIICLGSMLFFIACLVRDPIDRDRSGA